MAVVYLFDECLLDPDVFVAGGALGGPGYSNTMAHNAQTGIRKVNIGRLDFQHQMDLQTDKLTPANLAYLMNFWGGGYGSGVGFRAMILYDFYVINEVLGISDGTIASRTWQLIKTYKRPGVSRSYSKPILKPVVNALLGGSGVTLFEPNGSTTRAIPTVRGAGLGVPAFRIMLDGVVTTGYVVDNTSGIVTLTATPANGVVVSWSGEFDVPMRFLNNNFQAKPDISSEISGLQLGEILGPELGL